MWRGSREAAGKWPKAEQAEWEREKKQEVERRKGGKQEEEVSFVFLPSALSLSLFLSIGDEEYHGDIEGCKLTILERSQRC